MKTSMFALALMVAVTSFAAETNVEMRTGVGFFPKSIKIRVGDTVKFENRTIQKHTVTADPKLSAVPGNVILPPGAEPFHSGTVVPDASFAKMFSVPGRYRYVCLPHEKHGMVGEIIVEE